jgi:hypothetical protein
MEVHITADSSIRIWRAVPTLHNETEMTYVTLRRDSFGMSQVSLVHFVADQRCLSLLWQLEEFRGMCLPAQLGKRTIEPQALREHQQSKTRAYARRNKLSSGIKMQAVEAHWLVRC